jgi:preprotein translocase SecE subunit
VAEQKKPSNKKLVVKKKHETVRERADKSTKKAERTPRIRKIATTANKTRGKVHAALNKEYKPIKTGDSKVGSYLGKSKRLTPMYFVESFQELRKVTWPSRKTVAKLTLAVFLFSFFMATLVKVLDYGFDKLFKNVILK